MKHTNSASLGITTQESDPALSESVTGLGEKFLWQLRIPQKEPSDLPGKNLTRSSASFDQEPIGSKTPAARPSSFLERRTFEVFFIVVP
ncbi:unnamed protein product [Prunus armeniaca]